MGSNTTNCTQINHIWLIGLKIELQTWVGWTKFKLDQDELRSNGIYQVGSSSRSRQSEVYKV